MAWCGLQKVYWKNNRKGGTGELHMWLLCIKMKSFVMLFDATKGDFVKEALYTLSPKKALITAVMQYKENMNSEKYPKDLDGIYKSKAVKGRLLYDLTDNLTMYSQKA